MNRVTLPPTPEPTGTEIRDMVLGEMVFAVATWDGGGLLSVYDSQVMPYVALHEMRKIVELMDMRRRN